MTVELTCQLLIYLRHLARVIRLCQPARHHVRLPVERSYLVIYQRYLFQISRVQVKLIRNLRIRPLFLLLITHQVNGVTTTTLFLFKADSALHLHLAYLSVQCGCLGLALVSLRLHDGRGLLEGAQL